MNVSNFGKLPQMPEVIWDKYKWLIDEVVSLNHMWCFYKQIFGNKENFTVIRDLDLIAFNIISDAIETDITMTICRLWENERTSGQQNLTLKSLLPHCDDIPQAKEVLECFNKACTPFIHLRHKSIGHKDFQAVFAPEENPLPWIHPEYVDRIITMATEFLRIIDLHYTGGDIGIVDLSGAKSAEYLLYLIELGAKYQEADILSSTPIVMGKTS